MAMANGDFVGPYEILGWLGPAAGGCYRARDSRLAREVANQAIPGAAAMDAGRSIASSRKHARQGNSITRTSWPSTMWARTAARPISFGAARRGAAPATSLGGRVDAAQGHRLRAADRPKVSGRARQAIVHRAVKPDTCFITHEGT